MTSLPTPWKSRSNLLFPGNDIRLVLVIITGGGGGGGGDGDVCVWGGGGGGGHISLMSLTNLLVVI